MFSKSKVWMLALGLIAVAATLVIAEINIVQTRKSSIAVSTWVHKSRGIQDADRTTLVVQKAKIKKAAAQAKKTKTDIDPDKAVLTLTEIDKKKMEHYKVINSALLLQKDIYEALAEDKCSKEMLDRFDGESKSARGSLKELRTLTDEQIKIYKGTTKDTQAIGVANSTYYTWESAVSALSSNPIDDAKFAELDKKIQDESNSGVIAADAQAKSVSAADIDNNDKAIIRDEVLVSAKGVEQGMQDVVKEMQKVITELTKTLSGNKGNPIAMVGKLFGGGKKPPAEITAVIEGLQQVFKMMEQQNSIFSGSLGSFVSSAGSLAAQ